VKHLAYLGTDESLRREMESLGFDVASYDSVDCLLEGVSAETDGIVVEGGYDGVESVLGSARDTAPDASIVVVGDEFVYEGGAVFDFVPSEDAERVSEVVRATVEGRTQVAYPVPDDEAARAEEVGRYGDTDAEFDRLTRIAQAYFDSETAYVGLIDDREQSFLSCHGADIGSLPREESVCAFQILEDGEMVIEDLYEDARIGENGSVREFGFRSYAGAPLVTPSGARVGSFCVMDTEPRDFGEDDREVLRLFAEEASEKLVREEGVDR
jgi:hypothetical protein